MNKLKEEGKVKTVSVDSFEQNNLVLVDEGHRGLAGDVWKEYRDKLSAEGFAFEYSATFKQALKSQKAKDMDMLMDEYGKAVIMDYSYKYFYNDGYGKDYRIYNLKETFDDEHRQLYLVGCMLSFYQQMKLFNTYRKEYTPFMIEKPLLIFVGNRVTAATNDAEMTDVEEILVFIDNFVKNKRDTIRLIGTIIDGKDTGLEDSNGNELFYQDFNPLKEIYNEEQTAREIYSDILHTVFNASVISDRPRLHMINMKHVDGEIALKIGEGNDYFGVISVGDTSALIKKCDADKISVETEEFSNESLFGNINSKDSSINILIGSRKFSEGWNSWRVSTMGLINFAKSEGSQAIQLFDRGVRLHGINGCLKRSSKAETDIAVPNHIERLETLTIFGVRAQYMEDFRKYLEMEDMDFNETVHEFEIPVVSRYDLVKGKKLKVIGLPKDKIFKKQSERITLDVPDEEFGKFLGRNVIIKDCRLKVQLIESEINLQAQSNTEEHIIEKKILPFLNYQRIFEELENYKNEKLYYNIIIDRDKLQDIMCAEGWYSLIIPADQLKVDSMIKLESVTNYAVMLLKAYMDRFFIYHKEKWEAPFLEYFELEAYDTNFEDKYVIRYTDIGKGDKNSDTIEKFTDEIKNELKKSGCLSRYSTSMNHSIITALDLHNHLYTPLLHLNAGSLKIQVSPVTLNNGEQQFMDKLKECLDNNPNLLSDREIYLLRNKSRVGMGFFEAGNFYPDFILWIIEQGTQRIGFIDPKGLNMVSSNDPKIEFYKTIKEMQARMQAKTHNETIFLNSFIMSTTSSLNLSERWVMDRYKRESKNVYCLDNDDCVANMLRKMIAEKP